MLLSDLIRLVQQRTVTFKCHHNFPHLFGTTVFWCVSSLIKCVNEWVSQMIEYCWSMIEYAAGLSLNVLQVFLEYHKFSKYFEWYYVVLNFLFIDVP